MNPTAQQALPETTRSPSRLTLIGVGGTGARILQASPQIAAEDRFLVDSDLSTLSLSSGYQSWAIGHQVTRGLGCGGDVAHARALAEANGLVMRDQLQAGNWIILVAGAGGGVGAGMTPVVARLARDAGALVMALIVEPFEFEGTLRQQNAQQCLKPLRDTCDLVIRLSNQAIARLQPETTGIHDLFVAANRYVAQVVDRLVRLSHGSSLVPVGFVELERWARGRQSEGVAAFASAEGSERVQTLWNSLEQHPFLQSTSRFRDASGILAHIAGGPDLRRDELEFVHDRLRQHCPRAQLLMGAGCDADADGQISAFLLAVQPGATSPTVGAESLSRPVAVERPLLFSDGPADGVPLVNLEGPAVTRSSPRAARSATSSNRPALQQQFNFVPPWTGRFDQGEGTLHDGENLDEPTFVRRGIKFN